MERRKRERGRVKMEREKRERGRAKGFGQVDLGDVALSWSIHDILNDDLYRDQVIKIPNSFPSVEEYLQCYVAPLVEETRADLSSALEVISEAPRFKIQSIENAVELKAHAETTKFLYYIDVDFWKHEVGGGCETYKARNGDFFVLSSIKPESAEDLERCDVSYCMALVIEVAMDEEFEKGFKVKVSKGIDIGDDGIGSYKHAIFLANIQTNVRVWRALQFTEGMNNNFNVMKAILSPRPLDDATCDVCSSRRSEYWLNKYSEELFSMNLNRSQADAFEAAISSVQCHHSHFVKLIWGPPGTGKTKTVSSILWAFFQMNIRILTCAPTNVAVVGVCSRLLHLVKTFHKDSNSSDLPCSLGDVVLFGNKDGMEIDDELCDVFLDHRVDLLADCLSPSMGWKYRIMSVISIFEDCSSQYEMFLGSGSSKGEDLSFLEFFRKRFYAVVLPLKNCIINLWVHLPTKYLSPESERDMFSILDLIENFSTLISKENLTDENLSEVFCLESSMDECLQSENGSVSKYGFLEGTAIDDIRKECLQKLKVLKSSLDLPQDIDKDQIRSFCLENASLIFCTAAASSLLHHVDMDPLDALVIDEAAQLKECESVIPLRLEGINHVILVGDECQLPSMVNSQVCKEVGFGLSLFGRLVSLGYQKHLLNMQYRMHPQISFFPNSKFYQNKILDGPNVRDRNYGKQCTDLMYGPYAFINIADGREELDDVGKSRRNMVEVSVLLHIVRSLFKSWHGTGQKLSIGIVSPYISQVNAIKEKLGGKYDKYAGFKIRVKSVDGFQGEEDDVIILSTVRSNIKGVVGFLDDVHRINVALTRARFKLLILGNSTTLVRSGSIWKELVNDAKRRSCFFNANDNKNLAKQILHVKHVLDQLDDLLNSDSVLLNTARWKVLISDEFRKSFGKLSLPVKKDVIQFLLNVANGWRMKKSNVDLKDLNDSFNLTRIYRVRELYLVWSVDIVKNERYNQVIRIWDLLQMAQVERLIRRLDNVFSMYTDVYISHCKEVSREGKLEVPKSWNIEGDIIQYKKINKCEAIEDEETEPLDTTNVMENSKVSESLLLMKFYSLTSGVVKHLLTSDEGAEIDIPFELTNQEEEIIRCPRSAFILGRSGTGKTTVLALKMIQKEQHHCIAIEGFLSQKSYAAEASLKNDVSSEDPELNSKAFLKQVFITVSPKLCSAIRSHISRLKRYISGGEYLGDVQYSEMHDFSDNIIDFVDIPDSFHDLPQKHFPLVITFRKFLMMLDGSMGNSFFDRFYGGNILPSVERGVSRSVAVQAFIHEKEVNYDKFVGSYWPHFNSQLTKKLDASTVFTQIISHIKGGFEGSLVSVGKLEREQYIMLSEKRVSALSKEIRERIYDIFLDYENKRSMNGEFDLSDFVMDLNHKLCYEGYKADKLDFVYIDEVQDLTMNQISLLKYVCSNFEEGFIFAGDTAQTIGRGIDFRFEDIRALFYTEFLPKLGVGNDDNNNPKGRHIADIFQLNQNFRTHAGVLKLAQSIMDLLYDFFPSSVDKLVPETSLVYGEAPVILESSSDDNAIITIFGNSRSIGDGLNGFGAEQVILVRDDNSKKQVLEIVGKQALVLTIVECKGLEFQDVLLYNFFGGSPLRNKWRIVYQYMRNQHLLDSSVSRSFPNFDMVKHNLLCSELKQLYVAITRTRQRLWICETDDEFSRPMFDYWKRLCLVQVRCLDASLAHAMQTESSPEEWRSRGIKLFNEENFEMATMCFERAGDEYREKWAKAAGLVDTADHIISMNSEMGEVALKKAADIYESIKKFESAATCYIKLKDFRRAGMVYLEKCGTSRLESAGDCFAMAECWSLAADVFARSECFSKCLSVCSKGKLFDTGLQFIEQWKESCPNKQKHQELDRIKISFLESCALHYFALGDSRRMLMFVRAFQSIKLIRAFLKSRSLLDELILMEVEMGNFLEAAKILRAKGDIVLEAEMLEKATHFEKATQLILSYVIMRSLWSPVSKGWPLKNFKQKEELLLKVKLLSRKVSNSFHDSVCSEVEILSNGRKNLPDMPKYLATASKYQNTCLEFFTLRAILDVYEHSHPSKFIWDPEMVLDAENHAKETMNTNIFSVVTLMHIWKLWKELVLNILSYLKLVEMPNKNDFSIYEEFCLQYLGVRKEDSRKRYVLLTSEAGWIESGDRAYEQREKNIIWMNAHQFMSCGQRYWRAELFRIGLKVLEILESLHDFSTTTNKEINPFPRGRIIISIYEVAKFLKDPGLIQQRSASKIQYYCSVAEDCFFDIVFPLNWRMGTTECMMTLHDNEIARELLEISLANNINPRNGNLTHGQIGRVVMLLFLNGKVTEDMFSKIIINLSQMPQWEGFIMQLKTLFDGGSGSVRFTLVCKFQEALQSTTSIVNWWQKPDYMSPRCFIYLVECLMFFACAGIPGYFFCTNSSLFEILRCNGSEEFINTCLASGVTDPPNFTLEFIIRTIESFLSDNQELLDWFAKSSVEGRDYGHVVTKLVIILLLAHLNASKNPIRNTWYLLKGFINQYIPKNFYGILQQSNSSDSSQFLRIFSDALAAVGDPLVVICPKERSSEFSTVKGLIIETEELRCREIIIAKLFAKNIGNMSIKDFAKVPSKGQKIDSKSLHISNTPVKKIQATEAIGNDNRDVYAHFLQKFEVLQLEKGDHVEVAITVLDSAIEWLNHKSPSLDYDRNLLGMMRSLNDKLKGLSTTREKGEEPAYVFAGGVLQSMMQELQSCLRSSISAGLMQNQDHNAAEDVFQSDDEAEEAVKGEETVNDVVPEAATDAGSKNQSMNKKEDKKSRKKSKGKKSKGKKK